MADDTQAAAAAPDIQTFQISRASLGDLDSAVNLFRGNVTFPLKILSLGGRGGLGVDVSASYQSDVRRQVDAWNAVAPTGVLGLGWTFALQQIVAVPTAGSASTADLRLFIVGPAGGNELLPVPATPGAPPGVFEFQTRDHTFWSIRYFRDAQRWEIVDEDGTASVYGIPSSGEDVGGIAWAVAREAWLGASSAGPGRRVPRAWNLVEQRNQWGDVVRYAYDADDVTIAGDLAYTRATYLRSIVDVQGREVRFVYGEKVFEKDGVREYLPAHLRPDGVTNPPAYQDRYETRYLQSLEVWMPAPISERLLSIHFGYDLVSVSREKSGAGAGTLVKRYLTSMAQVSATGASPPPMRFEYDWTLGDVARNRGALASVTYAQGGNGRYEYARQSLMSASKTLAVESPGGTPRVWFGSDFVVVTWYDDSRASLSVTAYSWGGTWFPWSRAGTIAAKLADGSLSVLTGPDFFVVRYVDVSSGAPRFVVHPFRRKPTCFGEWQPGSPDALAIGRPDALITDVEASSYAAAASSDFETPGAVAWLPGPDGSWTRQTIAFDGSKHVTAAGMGGWLAACSYEESSSTASFKLWSFDPVHGKLAPTREWQASLAITFEPKGADAFWQETFLTSAPTFMAVSWLKPFGPEVTKLPVEVRAFQWTVDGGVVDPRGRVLYAGDVPSAALRAVEALPSAIGSYGTCARFDGITWQKYMAELPDDANVGYGDDLVVVATADGKVSARRFDPDGNVWTPLPLEPAAAGEGGAPHLAVADETFVVGTTVYGRGLQSDWTILGQLPPDTRPASVQNAAASCLAFERGTGAETSSRVYFVKNGALFVPDDQTVLDGRKITVDKPSRGTNLVGDGMLVAYLASQTFDGATSLLLVRLVDDSLAPWQDDFAVTGVRLDDGYVIGASSFAYDLYTATYDPQGLVPQYACVWAQTGTGAAADASGGQLEYRFFNGLPPAESGVSYPLGDERDNYSPIAGMLLSCRTFAAGPAGPTTTAYAIDRWSVRREDARGAIRGTWVRTAGGTSMTEIAQIATAPNDDATRIALDAHTVPSSVADALRGAGYPLGPDAPEIYVETPSRMPGCEGRTWVLFDGDADRTLILTARQGSDVITIETGLSITAEYEYDPSNGLTSAARTVNVDAQGGRQVASELTAYAASAKRPDGSLLYPGMAASHVLSPVLQSTRLVDATVVGAQVMTWRKGWSGAPGAWAGDRTYQALDGAASFDFTSVAPDPATWLLTGQVQDRGAGGQPIQSLGSELIAQASLFDATGSLPVATFQNAVTAAGEAAFTGFMPYESDGGWLLDGASPAAARIAGDGHTGGWSLRVPAGQTAGHGLARRFVLQPRQRRYLVSFWWKTDAGFADDAGSAAWSVTATPLSGAPVSASVTLADTAGTWRYGHVVLDLGDGAPGRTFDVVVELVNGKTRTSLLVDELFFAPFVGTGSARVFDPVSWRSIASVAASGQTTRSVRDGLGRVIASANGDRPTTVVSQGASRSVNADHFDPASPNGQLSAAAAIGGSVELFDDGEGWRDTWIPGGEDQWQQVPGALVHDASGAASLALRAADAWTRYAVQAAIAPLDPLTQPVAITVGGRASVRWNPGAGPDAPGAWDIVDATNGAILAGPVVPPPLFTLPARLAVELDTGAPTPGIREALASRGVVLSEAGVSVQVLARNQRWSIVDGAQRYRVEAGTDGLVVSRLSLRPQPWLVACGDRSVQLWVDGCPMLSWIASAPLVGGPCLTAGDRIALRSLVAVLGAEITVQFANGAGNVVQSQQQDGTTTYAGATLYDGLGRAIADTKWAAFDATLPAYRPGLVTGVDPRTLQLSGEIAGYYDGTEGRSDDQGYPYVGSRYEASPTGRQIEQGQPGQPFAVVPKDPTPHTQRTAYTASRHVAGYANGSFAVATRIGPGGQSATVVTDKLGRQVARTLAGDASGQVAIRSSQAVQYGPRGSTLLTLMPNAFEPGADPDDWTDRQVADLAGRLVERTFSGGGPTVRTIYDTAGHPRFRQDGNGAAAPVPYVLYVKYDALGRPVEQGWIESAWDEASLAAHADDPSWPSSSGARWTMRYEYDGDGTDPYALGRLWRLLTRTDAADAPETTEVFTYDADGRVVTSTLEVARWGSGALATRLEYDNAGRLVRIVYPEAAARAKGAGDVVYGYDARGLLATVGTSASSDAYARYRYDANRAIAEEHLASNTTPVHYNSPGWPDALQGSLFSEQLSYTSGGVGGRGYYDGSIAAVESATQWDGAPRRAAQALAYDDSGSVTASTSSAAGLAADAVESWSYDANGNITQSSGNAYRYRPGTNRLASVGASPDARPFEYDANGNVTRAPTRNIGAITYDRVTNVPQSVSLETGDVASVTFRQGLNQQRVFKETTGDGHVTQRLYVRSPVGPLLELVRVDGGPPSAIQYVQGPRGLLALQNERGSYTVLVDHAGSVRAVVAADGTPVAAFDYRAFGGLLQARGDLTITNYLFNGQELDRELGLYNLQLRQYDPDLGRFYASDPMAQYPSPYLYAANNPLLFSDPTGALSRGAEIAIGIGVGLGLLFAAAALVAFTGGVSSVEAVAGAEIELTEFETLEGAEVAEEAPAIQAQIYGRPRTGPGNGLADVLADPPARATGPSQQIIVETENSTPALDVAVPQASSSNTEPGLFSRGWEAFKKAAYNFNGEGYPGAMGSDPGSMVVTPITTSNAPAPALASATGTNANGFYAVAADWGNWLWNGARDLGAKAGSWALSGLSTVKKILIGGAIAFISLVGIGAGWWIYKNVYS